MLKMITWAYALSGSLYFGMYMFGSEVVERFAVGAFWLAMVVAPLVLAILVLGPLFSRIVK